MGMSTTSVADTEALECICGCIHQSPISDREIFSALNDFFSAGDFHVGSSLSEIQALDYFFSIHITEDVWQRYLTSLRFDTCTQTGQHRRNACDDECYTPDPD